MTYLPRSYVISASLALLSLIALPPVIETLSWPALVVALVICGICIEPVIRLYTDRNMDGLDPMIWIGVVYMAYFGVRAIHLMIAPEQAIWFPALLPFYPEVLIYPLICALLGISALKIGYSVSRFEARAQVLPRVVSWRRLKAWLWSIWAVSLPWPICAAAGNMAKLGMTRAAC